jgi:serine protease inhibitor
MKHFYLPRSLIISATLCQVAVFLFCLSPPEETKSRPDTKTESNPTASFIFNAIPENENATITPEYNTAINTFSINLLRALCTSDSLADKNVIVSPFNISRNLAIITEAGTGETKQELLDALGGQHALDDAQQALACLLHADNSVILQIADAIWVNANSFEFIPTFKSLAETRYGVQSSELDFTDKSTTVTTINSWIENNTAYYIRDMIDESFIHPLTACFITSAIYFKADWTSPFDVSRTAPQSFHTPSGAVEALMMMSDYQFQSIRTMEYQNARLYYGKNGNDFFFFDIYMPTTLSISEFIAERCPEVLNGGDSIEYSGVRLPKFSFENDLDMKAVLESIGIERAFDPSLSEITGMATPKNSTEPVPLFISKIVHTAGIKTDEEGTVAYAATVSTLDAGSSVPSEPVIFNRPFVYFIRAGENGLILFAGIMNNPNVSS